VPQVWHRGPLQKNIGLLRLKNEKAKAAGYKTFFASAPIIEHG
jgi:hypothetical protein